jgi:hypothetical protein
VTIAAFVAGFLALARSMPHFSLRPAHEYTRLGYTSLAVAGAELLLAAAHFAAYENLAASTSFVVLGIGQAVVGAGWLNAARMLRRVPSLLEAGEEPRAIALGANAMPGRARTLVVATDERIVWNEGHDLRLAEVERFETDRRTGALTVEGRGTTLRVSPVARPELEKFERLLSAPTVREP